MIMLLAAAAATMPLSEGVRICQAVTIESDDWGAELERRIARRPDKALIRAECAAYWVGLMDSIRVARAKGLVR